MPGTLSPTLPRLMRSATPIPVIDGELLDLALTATRAAALAATTWAGHGEPLPDADADLLLGIGGTP